MSPRARLREESAAWRGGGWQQRLVAGDDSLLRLLSQQQVSLTRTAPLLSRVIHWNHCELLLLLFHKSTVLQETTTKTAMAARYCADTDTVVTNTPSAFSDLLIKSSRLTVEYSYTYDTTAVCLFIPIKTPSNHRTDRKYFYTIIQLVNKLDMVEADSRLSVASCWFHFIHLNMLA